MEQTLQPEEPVLFISRSQSEYVSKSGVFWTLPPPVPRPPPEGILLMLLATRKSSSISFVSRSHFAPHALSCLGASCQEYTRTGHLLSACLSSLPQVFRLLPTVLRKRRPPLVRTHLVSSSSSSSLAPPAPLTSLSFYWLSLVYPQTQTGHLDFEMTFI